jgi:hypothetical protein
MLRALNQLIIRVSGNGWLFIVTTAVAFTSLSILIRIGESFPAVAGGAQPFDLQNSLTAGQVLSQLALYTDEAEQQYLVFTAIDYVFPFAAGLFLAAIAAFCLRRSFPGAYAAMESRSLYPLLMAGSLFDWCENIAALTAILSWPDTPDGVASAIVIAKRFKLTLVIGTQILVGLLLLATAAKWLVGRSRGSGGRIQR